MDTIVGIIVFIIIIVFWGRLRSGIGAAIIFGIIGGFFGRTGATIGMVLGFLIGVSSQEDSEKEDKEALTKKKKNSSTKSHESSSFKKTQSRIVRCPSCKKKIRVRLPLQVNKGKCVACLCSFSIKMDENGNLKVDKVCSGQLIPDLDLDRSSAFAGGNPSLN